MADASLAVAQEPPWSPWRDTALCMSAEAHLLAGDVDRAGALFAESSPWAATIGNTDTIVDSEAELAVLAMDGGRWAEAAEHWNVRSLSSTSIGCTTTPRACCLRRRGPARRASRRPAGGGPPAHAGDAGPSGMHVRAAVPRRACTPATCQGVPRHRRAHDGASSTEGDRRRLAPPPVAWRARRRSRRAPPDPHLQRPSGSDRRDAPHPSRASASPVPADAPDDPRDRGAAVPLPQHRQLGDRLNLPETRCVLARRRGASRRRPSVCSVGSRRHSPD